MFFRFCRPILDIFGFPLLRCALKLFTHVIERSSLGREFHNDGAAMANARSPSVALDFTDGIARSKVLEPLRL